MIEINLKKAEEEVDERMETLDIATAFYRKYVDEETAEACLDQATQRKDLTPLQRRVVYVNLLQEKYMEKYGQATNRT